jgi:hypothetical protein
MNAGEAARSYVMLAVGDALVAQIPALLISVASAMVVSRVGKDEDIGTPDPRPGVRLPALAGHCRGHRLLAWAWCRACRTWCSGSSVGAWAGWPG